MQRLYPHNWTIGSVLILLSGFLFLIYEDENAIQNAGYTVLFFLHFLWLVGVSTLLVYSLVYKKRQITLSAVLLLATISMFPGFMLLNRMQGSIAAPDIFTFILIIISLLSFIACNFASENKPVSAIWDFLSPLGLLTTLYYSVFILPNLTEIVRHLPYFGVSIHALFPCFLSVLWIYRIASKKISKTQFWGILFTFSLIVGIISGGFFQGKSLAKQHKSPLLYAQSMPEWAWKSIYRVNYLQPLWAKTPAQFAWETHSPLAQLYLFGMESAAYSLEELRNILAVETLYKGVKNLKVSTRVYPDFALSQVEEVFTIGANPSGILSIQLPAGTVVSQVSAWWNYEEEMARIETKKPLGKTALMASISETNQLNIQLEETPRFLKISYIIPLQKSKQGRELQLPLPLNTSPFLPLDISLEGASMAENAADTYAINQKSPNDIHLSLQEFKPLQFPLHPVSEEAYSAEGQRIRLKNTPSIQTKNKVQQYYLDLHKAWNPEDLEKVLTSLQGQKIWVGKGDELLTEANKKSYLARNFSLIPWAQLAENTLILTCSAGDVPVNPAPDSLKKKLYIQDFAASPAATWAFVSRNKYLYKALAAYRKGDFTVPDLPISSVSEVEIVGSELYIQHDFLSSESLAPKLLYKQYLHALAEKNLYSAPDIFVKGRYFVLNPKP